MARSGFVACCIYSCGLVPVGIVTALVLWSWYTVMAGVLIERAYSFSMFVALVQMLIFNVLIAMFLATYFSAICRSPGHPPDVFRTDLPDSESTPEAPSAEVLKLTRERNKRGNVRYCKECQCFKPDRAHHDSLTAKCVLRMDHFCPWVNNCVGYYNHRFFYQFLCYGVALCLFTAIILLPNIGEALKKNFSVMVVFFVAAIFSVALIGFSGLHTSLLMGNRTTLEMHFSGGRNPYDVGRKSNFEQIMGSTWTTWLLPVTAMPGDGVVYPTTDRLEEEALLSATDSY